MSMNTFDTRRKPMRKFVILAGIVILVVVGCLIMTLQGNTKPKRKFPIPTARTDYNVSSIAAQIATQKDKWKGQVRDEAWKAESVRAIPKTFG